MSVSVHLQGGFGNQLFEYIAARLYAEKHKLNLITELDTQNIMELVSPQIFETENIKNLPKKIINYRDIDNNDNIKYYGKCNYYFDDLFQNSHLFRQYREQIKNFFKFDNEKYKKNIDDLVIHIRIGGFILPGSYKSSECIHPESYLKILEELNGTYKQLYIVTEKPKEDWEKEYISYFDKYNPIIVCGSIDNDFNFIRKFSKIISSNSTFSYWAAFLSDADEIYCFNQMGFYENHIPKLICHGPHIKDLHKITDNCKSYDAKFYRNIVNKI